jgi:hypothetical protein
MKLKEQFRKTNLSTWINEVDTEKLENIADEFAIGFAEWMFNLTIREWENESTDDLLRYYKKEKGL